MTAHHAGITAIAYHLPKTRLTNLELAESHPEWEAHKVEAKTGIAERRIAGPDETAADLANAAARKLFSVANISAGDIDFIIYCTQSPDYLLPSTSCLIQQELGIPTTAGALDMNLGCSGFIYGLGLCKGLIETGQARRVLLLTADTYSKHIHDSDRSVRTIFGDAGAATLVEAVEGADTDAIGPFRYGTNGGGAGDLVIPGGGMRARTNSTTSSRLLKGGSYGDQFLYMNGPAVFSFTLNVVPKLANSVLEAAGLGMDQIDMVVPHQANAYMLEALRKRMKVPTERFFVDVRDIGNTVSATIPIALATAVDRSLIKPGQNVLLLGFGVGLSWAGTIARWQSTKVGVSDAAVNE